MDIADEELRYSLRKLFPLRAKKNVIQMAVPFHREHCSLTVGKVYAGLLILEAWRAKKCGTHLETDQLLQHQLPVEEFKKDQLATSEIPQRKEFMKSRVTEDLMKFVDSKAAAKMRMESALLQDRRAPDLSIRSSRMATGGDIRSFAPTAYVDEVQHYYESSMREQPCRQPYVQKISGTFYALGAHSLPEEATATSTYNANLDDWTMQVSSAQQTAPLLGLAEQQVRRAAGYNSFVVGHMLPAAFETLKYGADDVSEFKENDDDNGAASSSDGGNGKLFSDPFEDRPAVSSDVKANAKLSLKSSSNIIRARPGDVAFPDSDDEVEDWC